MNDMIPAVTLILDGARGIYIPRDFLTDDYNYVAVERCAAWGLTNENREWWEDATMPETEGYWEAWDWVLNNAEYTDEDGNVYHLHQDGDLWALCYERMTDEEKKNFGLEE